MASLDSDAKQAANLAPDDRSNGNADASLMEPAKAKS